MFNEMRKQNYLDHVNDEERPEVERLFEKAEAMEENYLKDLSECELEELIAVFHHLAPPTPERSVKNKEQVQGYIDWSMTHGGKPAAGNPLVSYGEEWCNQFVTSS